MRIFTALSSCLLMLLCLFLLDVNSAYAQRTFASSQQTGRAGLVCLNCIVNDPANAADGNLQTYSTLRVAVGLAAQTWQEVIFPGAAKVQAGTPVTIKFGSADNLLSLQALGAITLQAYNGATPISTPLAGNDLVTVLSNNNQVEVTFTPTQTYDRVRVTLNGGLVGALNSIYLYEAFYTTAGAVACNTAFDELHGISAGLLNLGLAVGGVVNPERAIDGDVTTASTLNAGVGLVGAYAQQTVIFNNLSTIGDAVRLTVAIPPALVTAGVLPNITVSTYNGNTPNNDSQSFNSSLINLRLLDGTSGLSTVTFTPAKTFDRVQLTLGGGVANVLSQLYLYEMQRVIPSPVVNYNNAAASNVQICYGSSATLTATAVPNTTFAWYDAATGGNQVGTGSSFTTPALTQTTTYYVQAMRTGCTDASDRTAVTINVSPVPTAPVVANNNVPICSGQTATFATTPVTGVTVNWYTAPTGGTPVFTGNSFTTPALSATTNYYAEATSGGGQCISASRTQVTATVTAPPDAPTLAATNVTICDGGVAVLSVASPQAGIQYNWYSTNTDGTILYTGSSFTTPALHANATYYVEAINNTGCTSAQRTQATVTVQPQPANPVLSAASNTVNAGQPATITVTNAQTGITYNWYTSATASTPVFSGITYTTPALYATTTYYVSAENSTGCVSASRTAITINVTINNNAPCSFATQQTNSTNGICIGCTVDNPALAVDADTTTASTLHVIAGLVGGYTEQQVVFQNPGFAGDTIKIGLQSPVNLADVGVGAAIQVILYNGATQVAAYNLNNSLINLSLLGGGGGRYIAYIPATGNYDRVSIRLNSGVAGLVSALNIYYAQQQFPKPVVTPNSSEICKGSTAALTISTPANGGTFSWFANPTGGTALASGNTYTTDPLNANATYYIEYSRNNCTSPVRYPVQIMVNDVPAAPTVAPANPTVNAGQTATVVATPPANATVNWYTTATGGTLVFTGNTFTTPVLNANTTYYAESASGTCVSTTRTPVTINVNPVIIPDIAVNPPTQTVDPGQTATFTASSTTPGTVFNWYTTPTGGTTIYTGPTFTTPAQFANTTYYAEASVPATGAVSASRAPANVVINSSGVNPVACDAAIDQTINVNALLCVGCAVNNAGGSVDNDRNTFSQLSVPVGVLNAYAGQTLRFATTGHAADSVVVELGVPGTLADVSVLGGISLATYNGTTYNNDRFTVNGSLLNVSLLNGQSRFRIAFAPQADFDRVEIRLNSAIAGVLSRLNIYDATQEVAAPVITSTNTAVCAGNQATLTATASTDATIKWYSSATGGSAIATGGTFTTTALNSTTTYYAEASRTADGCAQAVRTPVTVTVSPIPAAPAIAQNNVTVCSGQTATFNATPVSGVIINWYDAATGGALLGTGNTFTTPALTNTTTYYAEAVAAGGCINTAPRTPVTATVTPAVTNPALLQQTVTVCSGTSAQITATSTQPGVTFNWYTAATGGTPIFTGATFNTPQLTASTSYYVEAVNGTCTSPDRVRADVTVNPVPNAPTVTVTPSNGQVTSGQTATLTASSTTAGSTFNWYTTATGGTPVFSGPTFTTPTLTTNTTYYVEAVGAGGCSNSTRTSVTITVNPVFSTTCDFASTQSFDVNGGLACIGCTVADPNNAVDPDSLTYSRLTLPIAVAGSYVSQQLVFGDTGMAGDTVTVKIGIPASLTTVGVLNQLQIASYNGTTYNNDRINLTNSAIRLQVLAGGQTGIIKFVPGAVYDRVELRLNSQVAALFNTADIYFATKQVEIAQLAATTVNVCAGGNATFNVSNPRTGVTHQWYDAPVGGTLLATGDTYTANNVTANTTVYVQSVRTSNGCINPNRIAATANVTPVPVNPTLAQNAFAICSGDQVILSVTNAGTSTVNWYDAPTGGNLLFTGANFSVTPITTTSYYAELTNGTCGSSARVQATVTVTPRPAQPGVQSANVQVCAGSSATLQVSSPESGVTYNWYDAANGGNLVHTGTTFTTPAITANTTYYVEAASGASCTNNSGRTVVNITTGGQINAPTLSAAQSQICSGGSVSISVINPVSGIQYNWYTAVTGGTPIFTGTTYTATNVNANAVYYVEASNGNGCTSASRTETDINVTPVPTAPQIVAASGSLSACSGTSATLTVDNPQTGTTYRWYDAATGGTLLFTGTEFHTPSLSANATYYVEAAQDGNCNPSARTTVTVTVNGLPADPVLVATNVQVCEGSPATLSVSSPQNNVTYQWFDSPSLANKLFEGTTYVTGPITSATNFYVRGVNATGCNSANTITAQVTTKPAPAAPVVANGSTIQGCSGSSVTLTIANPQNGYTYNWYADATSTSILYTGTDFVTGNLTANTTYYVDAVNEIGCSSAARTSVTIDVNTAPDLPTVTANGGSTNTSVCSGSSITLNATSTTANVTFNWYDAANGGNLLFTGANYTTAPLTANTTYYVEAVNNAGGCTSASRKAVQVTINSGTTTAPMVNAADLTVCQNTSGTIHITNPDASTTYTWYTDATGGAAVATGSLFTTPSLVANTTYYVEALNAQSCSPSARVAVNVVVVPPPAAPVPASATLTICSGSTATLSVTSPQADLTYHWYDSPSKNNLLYTGATFTTPVLTASATFYVEAANGSCNSSSLASVQVTVNPALAALTAPIVSIAGATSSSITFQWTGVTGAAGYKISLDNGATFVIPSSGANGLTHTITGLRPRQSVTVIVQAIGGTCQLAGISAAFTGISTATGADIFIPNAFTPNGDGKNDILYVMGNSIMKLNFWVYDQWGELQFRADRQSSGWDGTYKGKAQPVGVYVYYLEATMSDGTTINRKGTINLIR